MFFLRGFLFLTLLIVIYIVLYLYVFNDLYSAFSLAFSGDPLFPMWRNFLGISTGILFFVFLHIWSLLFFIRLADLGTKSRLSAAG